LDFVTLGWKLKQGTTYATPKHSFRDFEDEANQQSSWGAGEASAHIGSFGGSLQDLLAALSRLPFVFMFQGTFAQVQTLNLEYGF